MIKPFHNAHLNWPIFLANTRIAVKSRRGKIVLYGVNYRFLKTFVSRRLFEFLWSRAHRKSSSSCSERTLGPKLIASQQLRLQLNVHHRRNDEPDYKPHKWTWLLRRLRHPFGPATLLSPVTDWLVEYTRKPRIYVAWKEQKPMPLRLTHTQVFSGFIRILRRYRADERIYNDCFQNSPYCNHPYFMVHLGRI